jgi:hypothetical protein
VSTFERHAGARWLRGIFFVLVVAAVAALHLGAETQRFHQDDGFLLALGLTVASALVALALAWLLRVSDARRLALIVALLIPGALTTGDGPTKFGPTVLAYRGEQVEGTVTTLRVNSGRRGRNANYTLVGPDGRRIPGEWTQPSRSTKRPGTYRSAADYRAEEERQKRAWDIREGPPKDRDLPIGAKITVVVDPRALVHPATPDVVRDSWAFRLIAAFVAVPAVLLALTAGGPLGLPWKERPQRPAFTRRAGRQRAQPIHRRRR